MYKPPLASQNNGVMTFSTDGIDLALFGAEPVSYTHLDVYKRQSPNSLPVDDHIFHSCSISVFCLFPIVQIVATLLNF